MKLPPIIYNYLIRPDWYNKNFITNILKEKYKFENKKVLDFGCGTGANCFLCKPENYLGVDPDKKRIEYAKNNNPNYHFETLDGKINTEENFFDIILIISVLHHIPDNKLINILDELKRTLKYPSGKIIVIEPCFFENNILNNYYMQLFDMGKYIRNTKEYLKLFKYNYFKINHIEKLTKLAYREIFFSASFV